jgi:hypothetical protein
MKYLLLLTIIEILSPRFATHTSAQIGVHWIGSGPPVITETIPETVRVWSKEDLKVEKGETYQFCIPSLEGCFTGTVVGMGSMIAEWYYVIEVKPS